MASVVTHYKSLNPSEIQFTVPEKIKGKYVSYVTYHGKPLFLQTSTMTIQKVSKDGIEFSLPGNHLFANAVKAFGDRVIDDFAENSPRYFNEKQFSKNKISGAYGSPVRRIENNGQTGVSETTDDHGKEIFRTSVSESADVIIKDQRGSAWTLNDLTAGTEAVAVVHVSHICIGKNTMTPVWSLQQMKIYPTEKLTLWCIANESDDESDAVDDEPDAPDDDVESHVKALEAAAAALSESNTALLNEKETGVNNSTKPIRSAKSTRTAKLAENAKPTANTKSVENAKPAGNNDDQDFF